MEREFRTVPGDLLDNAAERIAFDFIANIRVIQYFIYAADFRQHFTFAGDIRSMIRQLIERFQQFFFFGRKPELILFVFFQSVNPIFVCVAHALLLYL